MDISDIASLVAGSTLPLCVGIASFAVGCVLKYKEAPSSPEPPVAPSSSEPPVVPSSSEPPVAPFSPVPSKPGYFEPSCNEDYVQLKKDLRAGTHSTRPVLVQGKVTEAPNKGTFGGRFDSWVHNKETTVMKDKGKSAAGKARRDCSREYYAEVSKTTFSIPFHLQNKDMENVDKDITVTVVDIDKSGNFKEVLQKWSDESNTLHKCSYHTLRYGGTIAVLGTARLEDGEIVIIPTKVAKSVQSLLGNAEKSNIGNNASNVASIGSNASNVASIGSNANNSSTTNALLIVGGVLIAVGIGFVVYKIWRARQKPRYPGREENRRALDEDGDGDDHD